MTKWGAVGTASLNISTVYVCLACSSSSTSSSQNTPENSTEMHKKQNKKGRQVCATAMVVQISKRRRERRGSRERIDFKDHAPLVP